MLISGCAAWVRVWGLAGGKLGRALVLRLYSSIQSATARRAWARVVKWQVASSSNCRVENSDSAAALSSVEPAQPIDWRTRPGAGRGEHPAGVLPALVGVALAEGEPDDPPRVQVLDRGQAQPALVVGDLGQVPDPAHVRPGRQGEVAAEQVGGPAPVGVGPGQPAAFALGAGEEALLGHQPGHGVLADRPPQLLQVRGDP
jgi:hypothetical protein